jgi:hypothetical protein
MSDESSQDRRMNELWQSQPTEGVRMSVEQIQASAGKFQRKIQFRNVREYFGAAAVLVFAGFEFWHAGDLLVRIGFGLIAAGTFYLVWHLLSRGSTRTLPEDRGRSSFIEFQRGELTRQRDLLTSVWRWYLGPLVPGMAVLLVAFARANPGHIKHPSFVVVPEAIFFAACFLAIAKLNATAARRLQRQIDELDQATLES